MSSGRTQTLERQIGKVDEKEVRGHVEGRGFRTKEQQMQRHASHGELEARESRKDWRIQDNFMERITF